MFYTGILLRQEMGDESGYRFNEIKIKKDVRRREIGTLGQYF